LNTLRLERWIKTNTFHHSDFSNLNELVKLKREKGLKISLGFPTLNEEVTIAQGIRVMKECLQDRFPLLDEIAVIDSGSTDATREVARQAGADVYLASQCLSHYGLVSGKGENLWKSLYLLKGDILVWIDADISNIHPKFVYGVIGPLLKNDKLGYVKAFYERPLKVGDKLRRTGGGRVTELLVRPLLSNFYPELAAFVQPLSGEYAGRREILEAVPFRVGYGVEVCLLIDLYERYGLESLAQVDLDRRVHRNRRIDELSRMSFAILNSVLIRLKEQEVISVNKNIEKVYHQVRLRGGKIRLRPNEFNLVERPPMVTIKEYREKWKREKRK